MLITISLEMSIKKLVKLAAQTLRGNAFRAPFFLLVICQSPNENSPKSYGRVILQAFEISSAQIVMISPYLLHFVFSSISL